MKPYTMSCYLSEKELFADMKADIAALEAELADWKYVHEKIAERVFPGTTDSVDAVRQIVRERDRMREALVKISQMKFYSVMVRQEDTVWQVMRADEVIPVVQEALSALEGGRDE